MKVEDFPTCWIRGDLSQYKNDDSDPVRKAIHLCPFRRATRSHGIFCGLDYKCGHPAAIGEHEEIQNLPGGGVMAGGVDGYATFCEPVDMHLQSLGEGSRLRIDAEYRVIDESKLLPPGE